LKAAGHAVHVVHGSYKHWGTVNDKPLAARIGSTSAVAFGPTQAPRVTYLRQTLTRRAAKVLASTAVRMEKRCAEKAHSPITVDLRAAAAGHPADLYIAHYVAALPAAAHAARLYNARYAFDAEDFHLGDLPDAAPHALDKRIIRTIEGRYLPHAAFVTAASPMIAEAYADTYRILLPTTIHNVFPLQNAPLAPTSNGTAEPGPSIYWFSQTIGPGRGLETALEAIARAESHPHLYLRGEAECSYVEKLRVSALKAGIADRLHILPLAAPDELERLGAAYDVGLVSELGATRNRQIALTNKLFSYLLSGMPVVASGIPAHRRLAPSLGSAITLFPVGDASALAAAIDAMLLHPQRLAAARAHAWHLAQERFHWEAEAPLLLAEVEAALVDRDWSA
jgi:glycosyltransferase involved in cell wall biosynthesis